MHWKAVEFGAGTGHLGLALAYLRPEASVVLVEARERSAAVARERVERLGRGPGAGGTEEDGRRELSRLPRQRGRFR